MVCRRWRYRCTRCGHDYDLPGLDLTFSEIQALVAADPRVSRLEAGRRGDLTRKLVGRFYDHDSQSA